ncbi:MAG: hypothetical protein ABR985_07435 [Methanotrichaceae archaeon]|jgi:hypothetical protein
MNFTDLFTVGTFLLVFVLLTVGPVHIFNLKRVRKRIGELEHCYVSKEALYKEYTISLGSNFCALAFAAWIMLFVAIAYLYLLVPTVLPFSYMQIPALVSNPLGFAVFGVAVAVVIALMILGLDKLPEKYREFKLTEMYSFYTLSKSMKRMIVLAVPFLCASVLFSAYVGTVYPDRSPLVELLSLAFLFVSISFMVTPIYREALMRRL